MKLNVKKTSVLAAVLSLLLSLTACNHAAGSETAPLFAEKTNQKVYVSDFIPLDFASDSVNNGCIANGGVYLTGMTAKEIKTSGEPSVNIYGVSLFHGSLKDGKCRPVDGYQSFDLMEGTEGTIYSGGIYPGRDGTLWIATHVTYWDPNRGPASFLQQFDASGKELSRINLDVLTGGIPNEEICGTMADAEGRIYIAVTDSVMVFGSGQKPLFTVKNRVPMTPNDTLYLLSDGRVGVRVKSDKLDENSRDMIQVIDTETQGWGDTYDLPEICSRIYSGSGKYLFFCNAGDSLYGYDAEKQELERLLSWTGVNIDSSQVLGLAALEGEELAAVLASGGKAEIASLKKVDPSDLPEITVLRYAALSLRSDVRANIVEFNKSHKNCRIEVQDYSEYNTDGDRSQGIRKLNTELLAGKIDILDTAGLSLRQYGKNGLLTDLLPYLEKDPELGRDKVMKRVLEAAMQEGKLYQAFPSFSIMTAAGSADVVGERMSWTLEDLAAALKTMPKNCAVFGSGETKETLLAKLLPMELSSFIDWDAGKCSFTSDEFKNLLKFCNNVTPVQEKEENKYDWVTEGRQLLLSAELKTLYQENYLLYQAAFGGKYSFIGYPRQDGSAGSSFKLGDGMAITASCKDKDAAWSFVRELFLPRYPSGTYFGDMLPVNLSDFNRLVETVMTPIYVIDRKGNIVVDKDGQPVEQTVFAIPENSNLEIAKRAVTQEEYEQFQELYDSIGTVYSLDEKLYAVVVEEAGAYFSGDKTVEESVKQIQSRAELYLNERV